MTKRGKEIKYQIYPNYSIVFGTIDSKNPKAVYINISAWAEPKKDNDLNYGRVIGNLRKAVKQELYNTFGGDNIFDVSKTIVDLDIRESGVQYGKRSFMGCEITLFQKGELEFVELEDELEKMTTSIVQNIFKENEYFSFHLKKN